jgi:hypothetical protein
MAARGVKCWPCGKAGCRHGKFGIKRPAGIGAAVLTKAAAGKVILPLRMPDSLGVAKRCATAEDKTLDKAAVKYLKLMVGKAKTVEVTPEGYSYSYEVKRWACGCEVAGTVGATVEPCERHAMALRDYVPKVEGYRRAS